MTQEDRWLEEYNDVFAFIETNKQNTSKHSDEERGRCLNWVKHNRKLYAAGEMNGESVENLVDLSEMYRHKNKYE